MAHSRFGVQPFCDAPLVSARRFRCLSQEDCLRAAFCVFLRSSLGVPEIHAGASLAGNESREASSTGSKSSVPSCGRSASRSAFWRRGDFLFSSGLAIPADSTAGAQRKSYSEMPSRASRAHIGKVDLGREWYARGDSNPRPPPRQPTTATKYNNLQRVKDRLSVRLACNAGKNHK